MLLHTILDKHAAPRGAAVWDRKTIDGKEDA
jgi:hypothetical protein